MLQVVKWFNQQLFNMEDQLKAVEEGLKDAKKDAAARVQSALESQC